jgi:hypothetical protein
MNSVLHVLLGGVGAKRLETSEQSRRCSWSGENGEGTGGEKLQAAETDVGARS